MTAQNVWGLGYVNDLIERDQSTTTPGTLDQRIYAQEDANHNITSLTDANGIVVERYLYDPYGVVTVLNPDGSVRGDGTFASSLYKVPNLFQGMRYDAPTGNYTTPNRDYDPNLGTWLEEDPAGYVDGSNTYQMERSGVASAVDPSGLATEEDHFPEISAVSEILKQGLGGSASQGVPSGPNKLYEPNYMYATVSSGMGHYEVGATTAAEQKLADAYSLAQLPIMPQIDDGSGVPDVLAFADMAFDAFTGHTWSQGFDFLGVPDWHVKGPGTAYGHWANGLKPDAELLGNGLRMLAEVGVGAEIFEGAEAAEMAATSRSVSEVNEALSLSLSQAPSEIEEIAAAENERLIAGSIRNVNPTGGTMNCVNCSIATDLTLAGNAASHCRGRLPPSAFLKIHLVVSSNLSLGQCRSGVFFPKVVMGPEASCSVNR